MMYDLRNEFEVNIFGETNKTQYSCGYVRGYFVVKKVVPNPLSSPILANLVVTPQVLANQADPNNDVLIGVILSSIRFSNASRARRERNASSAIRAAILLARLIPVAPIGYFFRVNSSVYDICDGRIRNPDLIRNRPKRQYPLRKQPFNVFDHIVCNSHWSNISIISQKNQVKN